MKQRRLGLLLITMAVLLAVRLSDLRTSSPVVEAVGRAPTSSLIRSADAALQQDPPRPVTSAIDQASADRVDDESPVQNAFAVRSAPAPAPAVTASMKQAEQPKPPVEVPTPPAAPAPPPEPLPFTVIGSWRDDMGTRVFLAGPHGVLLAHVGDVLLAEYAVLSMGPSQLVLKQLNSNREISLPVPVPAASPLTALNPADRGGTQ